MTSNDIVATFRNSLTRFHDEASVFTQSHGVDPAAGSLVATERATYQRPESIVSVVALANLLIESVGEHVTLFVKSITEPVEPIACWTCVRSIMESSAIAAWLFDPGIDVKTRVGRSFALRYEGMDQEIKLARAMKASSADVQKLENRMIDVENVAASLGFKRVRNAKNKIIGIGQQMPSATEMIKLMLDEEVAYRLLSAVAHGHHWAIRVLGFAQGETNGSAADGVSTTAYLKHSGTVEGYSYLTACVAKSFALPLWNHCLYFGWDRDRLEKLLESVYDEFKGKPSIRFWRPKTSPTK